MRSIIDIKARQLTGKERKRVPTADVLYDRTIPVSGQQWYPGILSSSSTLSSSSPPLYPIPIWNPTRILESPGIIPPDCCCWHHLLLLLAAAVRFLEETKRPSVDQRFPPWLDSADCSTAAKSKNW